MNRYAAIDIGTNTILMMIAELDQNKQLRVVHDIHKIARLGEDLGENGYICDAAIERAKTILIEYKEICTKEQVSKIRICATSAMRDASNSDFVKEEFGNIFQTELNIISGLEEAKLSFLGTVEASEKSTVIDIGGGSTELILGENYNFNKRISMQLGAVRLTEQFFSSQPPKANEIEKAIEEIDSILNSNKDNFRSDKVYAVAGTPTTLAYVYQNMDTYILDKIHNYLLDTNIISELIDKFKVSDNNTLINKYHIHPKRADLILAGTLILERIMKYLKTDIVSVSAYGLRYGILKDLIFNQK